MTAYATLSDFANFGLPAKATAGIASATITAALESASRVVDSYIGTRYDLPLVSFDASVTMAACKIAAYELLATRGFAAGTPDAENVEKRYATAISWCRDVATGKATPSVITVTDQSKPPVDPQNAPFVASNQAQSDGTFVVTTPTSRGW